jgi:acetylornithine deacetylase
MPTSSPSFTARELLERLIAFDTTSRNSNLELIDWVSGYLAEHGIESRRTYDETGAKANLFATVGPEGDGGIVLSGHTDVVPVDGQDWSSDPFAMIEKDGLLYGRGTCDMKGFIACALALVPEFRARKLTRPLHFAFSYDEEVGCLGVHGLIEDLTANGPHPAMVLVGEPTEMRVVNAHKGVTGFRTRIRGKAAHSSQPHRGGNAVLAGGRLLAFLGELAREKRAEAAGAEFGFEPPYTTFGLGRIEGGTALNIVAQDCEVTWEFRAVPGEDEQAIVERVERFVQEDLLPELREFAPEAWIETVRLARASPLMPEPEGGMESLMRQLTGANASHAVSFATEGGLLQEAGMSTVVCGPGSIDQAHQPDEFIDPAQLEACTELLRKLAAWAEAPGGGLKLGAR